MFRRIMAYFLPGLLILLFSFRHPYHLSVTTIAYTKQAKTLGITIKMFFHDLEPAVNDFGRTEMDIKNHADKAQRDSLVYAYTATRFKVLTDGKEIPWKQKNIDFMDEYVLIGLSCSNVSGKKLTLKNTMCFETESTQTNLFHFSIAPVEVDSKQTKKTVNPKSEVNFELSQ